MMPLMKIDAVPALRSVFTAIWMIWWNTIRLAPYGSALAR
jgi:hypothetical protein